VTLQQCAARQGGLVSSAQARDHGLSADSVGTLARRRAWQRVCRGVYDVGLPDDVAWVGPGVPDAGDRPGSPGWAARRRRVRATWAALLAYGDQAVAVGACALVLHGVHGLPARLRPQSALPGASNRLDRDGVALRQFDDGMTTVEIAGRRVAALPWALAQAVPELPRRHGLAVLDSVLAQGLLRPAELDRVHDLARGRRGIATRHDLFELADARAESPLESFARLECIEGSVAPDVLQLPFVRASGTVAARADMAWELRGGRWLLVEMDGVDVHGTARAIHVDRWRRNTIVATGRVDELRFTSEDLGQVAPTVRAFLARNR